MLTLSTSLFIICGVFVTSILSGILGMAGGMVLMGLLAWVLPVAPAMVLHAVSQFFANGSRAIIHRNHIYAKSLKFYASGLAAVFLVFALVSFMPEKMTVFFILGIAPFLSFLLPKNRVLDFTKPLHAFFCGVTVMGFQLTGGVSGPLLDMFFQKTKLTRHQTVATKAATQALSHVARFVYFGIIIANTGDFAGGLPWWIFVAVIPAAIVGTNLSKHLLEKISDKQFFKATQIALAVIGTVYLCKAFSLWLERGF